MLNRAFSLVVLDSPSIRIAPAGTPRFTSNRRLSSVSPAPLTRIVLATPARNNSAARVGRSPAPPPSSTIASAFTSPLSTHRHWRGKQNATRPATSSSAVTPAKISAILRHFWLGRVSAVPVDDAVGNWLHPLNP